MKAAKIIFTPLFLFSVLWLLSPRQSSASNPDVPPNIALRRIADGFSQPTAVTSTGVQFDSRLFVLERSGKIKIIKDGAVNNVSFLDLEGQVAIDRSERGLLGLAFDPNYATNGYFYINYSDNRSDTRGDTIVKRFKVSVNPDVADSASGETILEVEQDFWNHNGGWLAFDPDGELVIGMGDGGSGGDPNNRAQSRDTLLGKMIRINVHGSGVPADNGCGRIRNYRIPESNPRPFGSDGWCSEIWSYGWRNPWRFSFDSANGDMWAGDVGQVSFEEINFEAANSPALQNYGWRCYEGNSIYGPGNCTLNNADRVDPVTDYGRTLGTSITGGYVYRGTAFPAMQGHYFYGDFGSGRLWSIEKENGFAVSELDNTPYNISSFGEGTDDELYLSDYGGGIYQLITQFGAKVELTASSLAEVNGMIQYTLTVTNLGTDDLSDVTVTNTIPAGVVYLSGGSEAGGVVTLNVGEIGAGSSKTVSWFGRSASVSTVANSQFNVNAQELNSPIPGTQGENQTTLVVEELEKIYLPLVIR